MPDMTHNYSLYTIPVAWALCLAPHAYAASLGGKNFDNRTPRAFLATLQSSQTLDLATKERIIRAEGAQQNGFENLGLFAAAVVAGNIARIDSWTLNALSGGYVLSRALFNLLYVNNTSNGMATARSMSYLSGIGLVFTLFIKAGNLLKDQI